MLAFEARSDSVHFRAVRLRGTADGLGARQRFESALAGLAASALGLPPQALLIVRHIAPAARLRLDAGVHTGAFGEAVRTGLAHLAQRAARPATDPSAAGATAVLFADEVELVTCLLGDWLRGRLGERWWWAAVLRGLPAGEWCRRVVLPRGDLVPAVLSGLAAEGQAVAWVLRLSEGEVSHAVAQVMEAHALQPFADTRLPVEDASRSIVQSPAARARRAATSPAQSHPAAIAARRRLREIVPEIDAAPLSGAQRQLLAIGLGLQRASAWTRSPEFEAALTASPEVRVAGPEKNELQAVPAIVGAFERFWRPALEMERRASAPPRPLPASPPPRPLPASAPPLPLPASAPPRSSAASGPIRQSLAPATLRSVGGNEITGAGRRPALETGRDGSPQPEPAWPRAGSVQDVPSKSPLRSEPPDQTEPLASVPRSRSVATDFGGIFYLLNVALALGLYGDFTQPRAPGIGLSPWDWLALIGRDWFGSDFERDAVWVLLAELAGRSLRQKPGYGFAAPRSWSVPAEWLEPWGEVDVVRVYATRRRLQLWHDAGFVLADTPRTAGTAPLEQAYTLCKDEDFLHQARLPSVRRLPHRHPSPANRAALSRWMRWIMLYLQARLARALGSDVSPAVAALVCRHSATLACTTTRLEVHLSLADLPIEIRLAGLDRDPGWIPAAGRSVAFYFA